MDSPRANPFVRKSLSALSIVFGLMVAVPDLAMRYGMVCVSVSAIFKTQGLLSDYNHASAQVG
jgi:hypothetical protein